MNWRQGLSLCFIPLLAVMVLLVKDQHEEKAVTENPQPQRKIASSHRRQLPVYRKPTPARSVSALKNKNIPHHAYRNRIPQSVEESFEKNNTVKVSRGYEFLSDVAAVPLANFNPALGTIIHKDENFVFFRANPGHSFVPVAISKSTKTLYPISSVVHIRGATPEMRNGLINAGYEQYYYQPALKFLSIQSKSGQVMQLYEDLSKKGFNVQLEVLKPHHQAI